LEGGDDCRSRRAAGWQPREKQQRAQCFRHRFRTSHAPASPVLATSIPPLANSPLRPDSPECDVRRLGALRLSECSRSLIAFASDRDGMGANTAKCTTGRNRRMA
jgi:hypothetical protein